MGHLVSATIEHLETRGLSVANVISKINEIKDNLKGNYDKSYYEKLSAILSKNKGYGIRENVDSILSGSTDEKRAYEVLLQFSPHELKCLQYAPHSL